MNIKRHIPNSITCCNLISGCIAVFYGLTYNMDAALLWIAIGAGFDFFDGMSARLLGVSSPIGKELDSLADVVTFGVAPSAMVFSELGVMPYPPCIDTMREYLPFVAFTIAAFSALRLAKFNLDERQTTSFIGLPTPANALFWGALLTGAGDVIESSTYMVPVILAGICLPNWLLIAEMPRFALKLKQWGWKGNQIKYIFILSCIPLLAIFRLAAFSIIIAWYVILSAIVSKQDHKE